MHRMRAIALSFLLIFTTFTAVLCTYFIWQDTDFTVVMAGEEEGVSSTENDFLYNVFIPSFKKKSDIPPLIDEVLGLNIYQEFTYEDVCRNALFSPPDSCAFLA